MAVTLPLSPTQDDEEFFSRSASTSKSAQHLLVPGDKIRERIIIERAVVRRAVTDLIAAGYELRLHDGESWATGYTKDVGVIMGELMATDEETICARGERGIGTVYLVYGNSGWEVIADHSVSLGEFLKGSNELADEIEAASV